MNLRSITTLLSLALLTGCAHQESKTYTLETTNNSPPQGHSPGAPSVAKQTTMHIKDKNGKVVASFGGKLATVLKKPSWKWTHPGSCLTDQQVVPVIRAIKLRKLRTKPECQAPNTKPVVIANFVIEPSGQVGKIDYEGQLEKAGSLTDDVIGCLPDNLHDKIKSLIFPACSTQSTARIPIQTNRKPVE